MLNDGLWRSIYRKPDLPFDNFLEQAIQEWNKFRRSLRKEDQKIFDQLFEKARLHAETGSNASRLRPFETILIFMLLEQEKEMVDLKSRLNTHEDQARKGNI